MTPEQTRRIDLFKVIDTAVTKFYTDPKTKRIAIPRAEATDTLLCAAVTMMATPDCLSAPADFPQIMKNFAVQFLADLKALSPHERTPEADRTYLP